MPSAEYITLMERLRNASAEESAADLTLQQERDGYEEFMAEIRDCADATVTPIDAGGAAAQWIYAPGTSDTPVILYLHGGGYFAGSVNTHRDLCYRLSKASGGRTLAVEYRLAPEHQYPAAVDDAVAAYRWLLASGVAANKIVVAGDSAGGGLALAVLLAARDAGDALPAAAVCISPWTDLECTSDTIITKDGFDPSYDGAKLKPWALDYMGDHDLRAPLASPVYADLKGLPTILIQVGDIELLLDDSTRLSRRGRDMGVDVQLEVWGDMPHCWHLFAPILPEGQQAIARIGAFIRQKTRR